MSSDAPLLRLPFETCNILKLLFFLCNYRSFEDKKQYEISSSPITFINLTVFHLDFPSKVRVGRKPLLDSTPGEDTSVAPVRWRG